MNISFPLVFVQGRSLEPSLQTKLVASYRISSSLPSKTSKVHPLVENNTGPRALSLGGGRISAHIHEYLDQDLTFCAQKSCREVVQILSRGAYSFCNALRALKTRYCGHTLSHLMQIRHNMTTSYLRREAQGLPRPGTFSNTSDLVIAHLKHVCPAK